MGQCERKAVIRQSLGREQTAFLLHRRNPLVRKGKEDTVLQDGRGWGVPFPPRRVAVIIFVCFELAGSVEYGPRVAAPSAP